jgi:hypothetical protein
MRMKDCTCEEYYHHRCSSRAKCGETVAVVSTISDQRSAKGNLVIKLLQLVSFQVVVVTKLHDCFCLSLPSLVRGSTPPTGTKYESVRRG